MSEQDQPPNQPVPKPQKFGLFSGVLGRKRFWCYNILLLFTIPFGLSGVVDLDDSYIKAVSLVSESPDDNFNPTSMANFLLWAIFFIITYLSLSYRRLADVGFSAKAIIIMLVYVTVFTLLIYLTNQAESRLLLVLNESTRIILNLYLDLILLILWFAPGRYSPPAKSILLAIINQLAGYLSQILRIIVMIVLNKKHIYR